MSEQYYNFMKRLSMPTNRKVLSDKIKAITWQESAELSKDYDPGEPDPTRYPGA